MSVLDIERIENMIEAAFGAPLTPQERQDLGEVHAILGVYDYDDLAHLVLVLLRREEAENG